MRIITVLLLLLTKISLFAQSNTTIAIHFIPCYGKEALHLQDSAYQSTDGDSVEISLFKFYVSEIELLLDNKLVWKEANSFHLINAAEEASEQLPVTIPAGIQFNQLKFKLGIDSVTNVAGAMGGDLDPMKGMYWTWQSGYINFKFEGISPQCKTRHHAFTYHLGGYHSPFASAQAIRLAVVPGKNIAIAVDTRKLLKGVDVSKINMIMTPGKEAVLIAEKAASMFTLITPAP